MPYIPIQTTYHCRISTIGIGLRHIACPTKRLICYTAVVVPFVRAFRQVLVLLINTIIGHYQLGVRYSVGQPHKERGVSSLGAYVLQYMLLYKVFSINLLALVIAIFWYHHLLVVVPQISRITAVSAKLRIVAKESIKPLF